MPRIGNGLEIYDLLGAGLNQDEFLDRWQQASKEVIAKVGSVSFRLRFIDTVQNHVTWPFQEDRAYAAALQAYLLITCFDVLAGHAHHQTFDVWIKSQDSRVSELMAPVESMAPSEAVNQFKQTMETLYKEWQDAHGVSRNFRQLFEQLPEVLQTELINSYAIVKTDESPEDWQQIPNEKKLRRIINYLFTRRNKFTHTAKVEPTFYPSNGVWGVVQFAQMEIEDKKHNIHFANADEIRGEPSLLRVILLGILRQLLGYDVDRSFIDLQWHVERMKRLARLAIREIESNNRLRQYYLRGRPIDLTMEKHPKQFVPKLSKSATSQLANDKDIDYSQYQPLSSETNQEIRADLSAYVLQIDSLNHLIEDFEQLALQPAVSEESRLAAYERIREAMRDGEWTQLGEAILGGVYYVVEGSPENVSDLGN